MPEDFGSTPSGRLRLLSPATLANRPALILQTTAVERRRGCGFHATWLPWIRVAVARRPGGRGELGTPASLLIAWCRCNECNSSRARRSPPLPARAALILGWLPAGACKRFKTTLAAPSLQAARLQLLLGRGQSRATSGGFGSSLGQRG